MTDRLTWNKMGKYDTIVPSYLSWKSVQNVQTHGGEEEK